MVFSKPVFQLWPEVPDKTLYWPSSAVKNNLHKLRLQIIQVHVSPPSLPVVLSWLHILSLLLQFWLRSQTPDLHMINLQGCGGGELDGVEGVHSATGAALTEVSVESETMVTRSPAHGQLVSSQHLIVLILASGVEHRHLGLNGEYEALTITNPAPLSVAPGCARVSPEHIAFSDFNNQNCGSLVTNPLCHLLESSGVFGSTVKESPVLSVLQQQVGVDEEDGSIVKTSTVLFKILRFGTIGSGSSSSEAPSSVVSKMS